jgi:hypothetical protein
MFFITWCWNLERMLEFIFFRFNIFFNKFLQIFKKKKKKKKSLSLKFPEAKNQRGKKNVP